MRGLRRSEQPTPMTSGSPEVTPDALLVDGARRDPDLFSHLFDRYWDQVFRVCFYRLGNWHEAEDAASQVFLNALTGLDRFQDDGREASFRCWLFTIARNVVINAGRKDARRAQSPLEHAAELAARTPGPEEAAIDAERHRLAHALLLEVTPEQRELLELRLSGLTSVEIASVLGKTPTAVRVAQHRAVERLRTLMQRDDTWEAGALHV